MARYCNRSPNKVTQPTPDVVGSSAFAGYVIGPAWLVSGSRRFKEEKL
jgi:hypothetical protein